MKMMGGVPMPNPILTGASRDGILFAKSHVDDWTVRYGWSSLIGDPKFDESSESGAGLMLMERTLENAISETGEAFARYDEVRKKFRSEVKNDLSSVEASAKRLAAEFERIVLALGKIERAYTSAGFVQAVANAEKLAEAMNRLSGMKSCRASVDFDAGGDA